MNSPYDPCPCESGRKFKFCCLDAVKTGDYSKMGLEKYPVYCFGARDYTQTGLNPVLVARKISEDSYIFASYLIDMWCMGVKDAFIKVHISEEDFKDTVETYNDEQDMAIYSYEQARSLILASVIYADGIGIAPHPDWESTKFFIEPNRPFENRFTFGRNGRPFYVTGPYDQYIQDQIIKKVVNAGGDFVIEG